MRAGALSVALVGGGFAGACDFGGAASAVPGVGEATGALTGCPKGGTVEAYMKHDWAGSFGLDAQAAAQIKGGVVASLELERFAARLDADLKAACGPMAKELGKDGNFETGADACEAAATGLGELRGQIGGDLKIELEYTPPVCAASLDAYADCMGSCDASVDPGSVEMECKGGELVGKCNAECSGTCHLDAAASCEGTCNGSCSANFSGSCGGDCSGKCDGKKMDGGYCEGTCEGSCSASGSGSCGGSCDGSCELSGSASCSGQCEGSCSAEFEAPKCNGEVVPPKASAECQASCDARMSADVKCEPPMVNLRTKGGANAEALAKYRAVISTHLPAVLSVGVGLKDEMGKAVADVKAVVEGGQSVVAKMKSSGGASAAKLGACVAAPFAAAAKAAGSIQASASVSVKVSASASGSASAG